MVLFSVMVGIEVQPDAELPELNGDRAGIGAALQNRNRKLAAHQEAGFLAIGGNQVRLRQDLQKVAGLQRLDESAQVQIGSKGEDIQGVGNGECVGLLRLLPAVPVTPWMVGAGNWPVVIRPDGVRWRRWRSG